MKKVMFIAASDLPIPAYLGGATETLTEQLLLSNNSFDSYDVTVYSNCDYKNEVINGIDFKYIKKSFKDKLIFRFFWILRQLSFHYLPIPNFFPNTIKKYDDMNKYDVVVLEGNKDQVCSLRRVYKGKIILHIHTVMTFTDKVMFAKKVFQKCDCVIANSNYAKRVMERIDPKNSDKISVLINCVKLSEFRNDDRNEKKELLKKYNLKDDDFIVTFCGRLERGKGVLELIKAYKKTNIPGKLLIVGSSWFSSNKVTKYIEKLKKEAENIKEKIVFTGYVQHKDIPSIYHISDVAVMPSIYEEAAGLVAIEAQAAGIPVIVSNVGGIPEYVDRESELIINYDEEFIDNIADAIRKLYYDANYYCTEKAKAIRSAQRFDISNYQKEFINIMESAIER